MTLPYFGWGIHFCNNIYGFPTPSFYNNFIYSFIFVPFNFVNIIIVVALSGCSVLSSRLTFIYLYFFNIIIVAALSGCSVLSSRLTFPHSKI